jgi:hypothetical protein
LLQDNHDQLYEEQIRLLEAFKENMKPLKGDIQKKRALITHVLCLAESIAYMD